MSTTNTLNEMKDVEQGIIGVALDSKNWQRLENSPGSLVDVQPAWFNDPRLGRMFGVLMEAYQSGKPFDAITIWPKIQKIKEKDRKGIDRVFLADCTHNAPDHMLIPDYAEQLHENYVDRELDNRLGKIQQLRDGKAETSVITTELDAMMTFLKSDQSNKNFGEHLGHIPYSQIEEEPSYMLWDGYIPASTVTMLGGGGGSGKTTLALQIASQVTKGTLEGDYYGKPGKVAYVGLDDDKKRVTLPRARATGMNLDNFEHLFPKRNGKEVSSHRLMNVITELEGGDFTLIILDPASGLYEGDNDNPLQVERFIHKIIRIAERTGTTFLCLSHVRKSGGRGADALLGSTKWRDSARSVLLMAKKPDGKETVLSTVKFNLGKPGHDRLYAFKPVPMTVANIQEKDMVTLDYLGESKVSAEAVLNSSPESYEEAQDAQDKTQWILEQFSGQTTSMKDEELFSRFKTASLGSRRTYRRVKDRAGLITERVKGFQGGSIVYLPDHVPPTMGTENNIEDIHPAQPRNSVHIGENTATFPHDSNVPPMRTHSGQNDNSVRNVSTLSKPLDSNENKQPKPQCGHGTSVKQASDHNGTCPLHGTPLDDKGGCAQCLNEQ